MLSNRLKFRVWDNRENKYVKSDAETQFLILETGNLVRFEKDRMTVHINAPSPDTLKMCGSNYVVEQCTGINDKKGTLIYEGDFITDYDNHIFQVCWNDGIGEFEFISLDITNEIDVYPSECVITGNIHSGKE